MSQRPLLVVAALASFTLFAGSAMACQYEESQASDPAQVAANDASGSTAAPVPATTPATQPN